MPARVPFNDLGRRAGTLTPLLAGVAERVIASGWYLLGPETEAFEAEFAAFCGAAGAVAVGNGTDALELALRGVGCEPADEVIVSANAGMYASVACLAIGATPVYADVDPRTLLLSAKHAAGLVTERTRAVVATHLYGNVVDVDTLRAALPDGVAVVEDGAEAHGATLAGRPTGSLGDVAAFSFYPTKNLGALGDAGAVVARDPGILERVRALRQYGWQERHVARVPGGRNSRMDELQAAFLRALLPLVGAENDTRRALRTTYHEALGERVDFVAWDEAGTRSVVHLCVVRSPERERLLGELADDGIGCAVHYPVADHLQPALAGVRFRHEDLDETERACREVLSLPCFPELTDAEVDRVIAAVERRT